jgi:GxxExxY protein
MESLLYEEKSYLIIGICMEVHKKLGNGFLESVYQEVLENEFNNRKIPFERQRKLELFYKGTKLKKYFMADFICFDKILVEIKAAAFLHESSKQQVINYLKATDYKLGLLINFGGSSLQWKRFINSV